MPKGVGSMFQGVSLDRLRRTVPYGTLQYPTLLYSTLQFYPTLLCSILQQPYSTLKYPRVPCSTPYYLARTGQISTLPNANRLRVQVFSYNTLRTPPKNLTLPTTNRLGTIFIFCTTLQLGTRTGQYYRTTNGHSVEHRVFFVTIPRPPRLN